MNVFTAAHKDGINWYPRGNMSVSHDAIELIQRSVSNFEND